MGTILLILFFIFIVWPIIKVAILVSRVRKKQREVFEAMYGQRSKEKERKNGWQEAPAPRKKKIDPSVGEYVSYEEITVTDEQTEANRYFGEATEQPGKSDRSVTGDDQQVSDADWEDI